MENTHATLFECRHISKTFPGVNALINVDFDLRKGEIHGLIGENGAGKSTLIKIFSGVYQIDHAPKGTNEEEHGIFLDGQRITIKNVAQALEHKISTIHQELTIIPHLMVYENIFLNEELKIGPFIDRNKMISETQKMLDSFGADFMPTDVVQDLSADRKKLVEVLRAIRQDARILIMDEPTSVLTDDEAKHLFSVMNNICTQGIAIIFISHNLGEIVSTCDRITVLRNGEKVGLIENPNRDVRTEDLVTLMVGHKLDLKHEFVSNKQDQPMLEVRGLNFKKRLVDINFQINKGEILGLTGLVGSGGNQLARTLFGVPNNTPDSGEIFINGKHVVVSSPKVAYDNGMVYLTEDRKGEGLFLGFNIKDNICISSLKQFITKPFRFLNEKKRKEVAKHFIERLRIKTLDEKVICESLSGGNQQKVVVSKLLQTNPDIMIMAEPTVGIDVGAKAEIRDIIRDLASNGKSVLLITNEFVEMNELCDRVMVMFKGEIIKELPREEIKEEIVLKYALGGLSNA